MPLNVAFAGFRHDHILSLLKQVENDSRTQLVACCEEDSDTRNRLQTSQKLEIQYSNFRAMLEETNCQAVAIGDYFARRGSLAIQALKAGKHVLADKPLCTSLKELEEIQTLAEHNHLVVNSMLTMRSTSSYQTLRRIVLGGRIGEPRSILITGEHPLNIGIRPQWYFMPSCQGGTILDIGIHVFDVIPWLTGHAITDCCAARCWNGKAADYPWFKDCGQFMLKLDNGCGVLADVSYLAPEQTKISPRQYWRCTVFGDKGVTEYQNGDKFVTVQTSHSNSIEQVPCEITEEESYLDDFINEINGKTSLCHSTTKSVLATFRQALEVQASSDE